MRVWFADGVQITDEGDGQFFFDGVQVDADEIQAPILPYVPMRADAACSYRPRADEPN